jgi:hypothetical protein
MRYLSCLLLPLFVFFTRSLPPGNFTAQSVAAGHLPVVSADPSGALHLVYGQDSTIYYATASGPTSRFNQPLAVASLPGLVAGAKRGPQIAVTDQFVVVTAVNWMEVAPGRRTRLFTVHPLARFASAAGFLWLLRITMSLSSSAIGWMAPGICTLLIQRMGVRPTSQRKN